MGQVFLFLSRSPHENTMKWMRDPKVWYGVDNCTDQVTVHRRISFLSNGGTSGCTLKWESDLNLFYAFMYITQIPILKQV